VRVSSANRRAMKVRQAERFLKRMRKYSVEGEGAENGDEEVRGSNGQITEQHKFSYVIPADSN